jgi:hypothetical protein
LQASADCELSIQESAELQNIEMLCVLVQVLVDLVDNGPPLSAAF